MKNNNQLKMGAILSYLTLLVTNIISIMYTPIMLQLLGQAEYGLYNLSNSVVGYLGLLNFGFGNAIVRYTSKYKALNDDDGEANVNGLFLIVYTIIGILVAIIGSVLVFNVENIFSASLSVNETNRMKILVALMVFNMAISFPFGVFGSIINAYEKYIYLKVIGLVRAILNPFLMLPLLLLGYKSIAMTVLSTILNVVFIAINIYYCFKILKVKIKFTNLDFSIFREIFIYSSFIFLNMIVDKIYWSTDQLILGAVSGTVAVAVYSIGSTFNTYYMSFSTAISGVFLPKITKMVTANVSDKELSDLFIKTGRIQYIIMAFIISGFLLVGKEFIYTWAGTGYEQSFYIALIVMIPLTIPLIQNIGITILQAKNLHKFRSVVYIIIAIINVAASIPMAKLMGGIGAALCTSISMLIGNVIIINIYYYKKINIDIPRFWCNILKMSIPVLISLVLGGIIIKFITISGYLGILIKASIFSVIFIALMWRIGMNEYEKVLFSNPIKRMKSKVFSRINIA